MKNKFYLNIIFIIGTCIAHKWDAHLAAKFNELAKQCSDLQNNFTQDKLSKTETYLQEIINEVDPLERRIHELKSRVEIAEKKHLQNVQLRNLPEEPVLSFIMPAYNRSNVIRQSLNAIYDQNLDFPFEVIVVDDCSTDNTFNILKEYEQKYSNFFAYKHEKNKRAPSTRNTAIAYARSKYICNVDSDDVLKPNTISPMLKSMIMAQCDICFFDVLDFFTDNNFKNTRPTKSATNILKASKGELFDIFSQVSLVQVSAGNRIFTKKSWLNVGGYLEMRGHDSWAFSFLLLAKGYRAHFCPGSSYWHRVWSNKTSMWNNDQQDKVDDISPLEAVSENLEIFQPTFDDKISKYKPNNSFISYFVKTGIFQLRNKQTISHLFNAYRYENTENFDNALVNYKLTVKNGISSSRVYLKLIRMLLKLKKIDEINGCLVVWRKTLKN